MNVEFKSFSVVLYSLNIHILFSVYLNIDLFLRTHRKGSIRYLLWKAIDDKLKKYVWKNIFFIASGTEFLRRFTQCWSIWVFRKVLRCQNWSISRKAAIENNNVDYVSCMLQCVYHFKCKSVNYNHFVNQCKLLKTNLNGKKIQYEDGWTVLGTEIDRDQVSSLF